MKTLVEIVRMWDAWLLTGESDDELFDECANATSNLMGSKYGARLEMSSDRDYWKKRSHFYEAECDRLHQVIEGSRDHLYAKEGSSKYPADTQIFMCNCGHHWDDTSKVTGIWSHCPYCRRLGYPVSPTLRKEEGLTKGNDGI